MSLALLRPSRPHPGLARAARLMQALGPDAQPIWAELSPAEAEQITAAMDAGAGDAAAEDEAAQRFLAEVRDAGPGTPGLPPAVWPALSRLPTDALLALVSAERAQTLALILSRLHGEAAARLLRALPPATAIEAMQRLLHLGDVNARALGQLEDYLTARLPQVSGEGGRTGHERLARIFDRLDGPAEAVFLAALENAEPGAGAKVRALMFTFEDLPGLGAGGLQTLLASADRASLVIALKGAPAATAQAFFANMTARASALLQEEIAALGPVRRSEIDAARQELVSLARALIHRGEIRAGARSDEDELVE